LIEGDGAVHEWEAAWQTLGREQQQLFTSSAARTLLQFWQQCYFEDLWAAMAYKAASALYLELGSGRGTTSMYLASRNCDVTMVDLSSAAFELASRNFAREGLHLPALIVADARSTGVRSGGFDCVFNIGVLEHMADPKPLLEEAVRLLAPEGLLFMVIVPERGQGAKALARLVFCPWRLARQLAGSGIRLFRNRAVPDAAESMFRSSRTRFEYCSFLRDLPVTEVSCVPFNPYHPVYRKPELDCRIALPLYRLHHALKRSPGTSPRLRTLPGIAMCYLLTARKRAAA